MYTPQPDAMVSMSLISLRILNLGGIYHTTCQLGVRPALDKGLREPPPDLRGTHSARLLAAVLEGTCRQQR